MIGLIIQGSMAVLQAYKAAKGMHAEWAHLSREKAETKEKGLPKPSFRHAIAAMTMLIIPPSFYSMEAFRGSAEVTVHASSGDL